MATVEWTDERLNDAFDRLMAEMAAMRADMKDMRAELKGDIASLRAEVKGDIADLRTELKGDIADLRTELKGEISELRSDMRADNRALWTALVGSYVSFVIAFVVTQL